MHDEPEPPRQKYELKPKAIERINPPAGSPVEDPLVVSDMLRQNVANDPTSTELPDMPEPPKSYRLRDYILLLVVGNGAFLSAFAVFPRNPVVVIFVLSGMTIFTIAVSWVMWVVMDRY
jgi:hypothetical protein